MKDDELIAENARLNKLIDDAANYWLALQITHPIPWEGAIDAAMQVACNRIETLTAEVDRLKLDLQAKDCLQDSAYQAGMKHGWNCAVSGDRDAYDTAISSEHIAELRRVNEARAALQPQEEALTTEVERKDAALQAYLDAFDKGTGTVYVEPIIRAALQPQEKVG